MGNSSSQSYDGAADVQSAKVCAQMDSLLSRTSVTCQPNCVPWRSRTRKKRSLQRRESRGAYKSCGTSPLEVEALHSTSFHETSIWTDGDQTPAIFRGGHNRLYEQRTFSGRRNKYDPNPTDDTLSPSLPPVTPLPLSKLLRLSPSKGSNCEYSQESPRFECVKPNVTGSTHTDLLMDVDDSDSSSLVDVDVEDIASVTYSAKQHTYMGDSSRNSDTTLLFDPIQQERPPVPGKSFASSPAIVEKQTDTGLSTASYASSTERYAARLRRAYGELSVLDPSCSEMTNFSQTNLSQQTWDLSVIRFCRSFLPLSNSLLENNPLLPLRAESTPKKQRSDPEDTFKTTEVIPQCPLKYSTLPSKRMAQCQPRPLPIQRPSDISTLDSLQPLPPVLLRHPETAPPIYFSSRGGSDDSDPFRNVRSKSKRHYFSPLPNFRCSRKAHYYADKCSTFASQSDLISSDCSSMSDFQSGATTSTLSRQRAHSRLANMARHRRTNGRTYRSYHSRRSRSCKYGYGRTLCKPWQEGMHIRTLAKI